MKRFLTLTLAGLTALTLATGCKDQAPKTATEAPQAAAPAGDVQKSPSKSGTVTETMNAGGYTYVQVDTGSEKLWAAAPEFPVKVGDAVVVPEGMPMTNYHSKTLDRDFDVVYFVNAVMVAGAEGAAPGMPQQMPAGHPAVGAKATAPVEVDLTGIAKAEGGKTVEEIFTGKADLADKDVVVRGKVVKFSPNIMGTNWLHLQDGTGAEGTNDLTVTSSTAVQKGDTVLVKGKLTVAKDFGSGYYYDVIIQDAQVTVE